jgi:hypothetical protein
LFLGDASWSDVLLTVVKNPSASSKYLPGVDSASLHETDPTMPVQNILVWFNDGVSKSHYIYNLPKTWAFLESLLEDRSGQGGFLFQSHNVLGPNSPPNFVPLFTGHLLPEWKAMNRTVELVNATFFLKRFQNAGFVTAFYEDAHNVNPSIFGAWTAINQTRRSPALYFNYGYMKLRYALTKKKDPVCFANVSSNMVNSGVIENIDYRCECVSKRYRVGQGTVFNIYHALPLQKKKKEKHIGINILYVTFSQ